MSPADDLDGLVAIVGLSGRFPGARDIASYWKNLREGAEGVTFFTDDQLEDGVDPAVRASGGYVAARPVLTDVDKFDAAFFEMHDREAALTDPQHRVFLEIAWEALEDAGYDPAGYKGAIGVFAGCSMNTYFLNNVCSDRRAVEEFTGTFQLGDYPVLIGAGREFLATRLSYKLDLRGPSMTVQTACSTSLVAIAQACQSLLLYQSDMAIAGGVSISFPQQRGYLHQEGGMASADGHCRPFDAAASGTIFGSGAGVVVLKRLSDALADGDHIYSVVRGCGVTNDGAGKAGFAAPSVDGQVAAIEHALAQAGLSPDSISYIECHGTATPLGDPIEVAALNRVFGKPGGAQGVCAIGSVKGNIGHLDAAAGVAGLIKTALMLHNRELTPTVNFKTLNPHISFKDGPLYVNTASTAWATAAVPRRAGVTALGVGGTNAHIVMEEPPARPAAVTPPRSRLLLLAARTSTALDQVRLRLSNHLADNADLSLADVAHTLQSGRRHFAHRLAVVCADIADACAVLAAPASARRAQGEASTKPPAVAFMFPGQGSQYKGMARGLYERWPVFRKELDRCAELLSAEGIDLIEALYGADDVSGAERLARTAMAQPAIFSVSYALAKLWQSWGVNAHAYIGHSVGEFVAACLAEVFSLPDALRLIAARGRLMQDLPPGGMLSVRLSEAEVSPFLGDEVAIAAVNSPVNVVLAGPHPALDAVAARLAQQGSVHRKLQTSHAFHSPMVDPMVGPFEEMIAGLNLRAPKLAYVSSVTGDWIKPSEATSPAHWARHAREPVRFADAISTLAGTPGLMLLETGPGAALSTLALQTAPELAGRVVYSLMDPSSGSSEEDGVLSALGKLWIKGVQADWRSLEAEPRQRVSLPTYPFERRRHWIEAPARGVTPSTVDAFYPPAPQISAPAPESIIAVSPAPAANSNSEDISMDAIREAIVGILSDVSGAHVDPDSSLTFLELGFDSLLLAQVAQQLDRRLKVKIAFRQLLVDLTTIPALADHVRAHAKPAAKAPAPAVAVAAPAAPAAVRTPAPAPQIAVAGQDAGVAAIMRAQVDAMSGLFQAQLDALKRLGVSDSPATTDIPPAPAPAPVAAPVAVKPAEAPRPSRFQVYQGGARAAERTVSPAQKRHIEQLAARVTAKTRGSKDRTAAARRALADPRAASGFRAEWKELVYPLVCARSAGARIWDIDGNEYIDLVNGYGPTAFGHSPQFLVDAIEEQLKSGFATGPQAELAAEVATLFTEMTGNERMTFCNTGSEAVMAAMRVARTVTGRDKVVVFDGAYHGQFDEVLVRSVRRPDGPPKSAPIAVGIPSSAVENMVVLDYGAPEALEWIRQNSDDIAAVLVEPVQSRHPDLQPFEFLRSLRDITEAGGIAFVMDEIVTGFRTDPGGMQAVTGIRADLATYGKVIGGGLPIGILAGKAKFMDALDGGQWSYGDDSAPEAAVTFFAGTFVRHPLVLAAVRAVLRHLKAQGPALQQGIAEVASDLAQRLNAIFTRFGLKARAERYSSFLYFNLHADGPLAGLLFYHLRDRGVYAQDGFPLFLSAAHSHDDVARIAAAFEDSFAEMARGGIIDAEAEPIEAAASILPLSEGQKEIWLSAQNGAEASCAFNESVTLRLTGPLDKGALDKALECLLARHDALRLRFSATGESMTVSPDILLPCPLVEGSPEALDAYLKTNASTPFDLVAGAPIRAQLFKFSETSHALAVTAHHIICDGWSINVIVNELAELYASQREGRRPDLGPVMSFGEYARAKAAEGAAEDAAVAKYWAEKFATPALPVDLPTDRPRPAAKTYAGATAHGRINAELYRAVKAAGAKQGCSLFVSLLSAFYALMGRLAGVEDLVVAVPTAGQSLVEDRTLVGHCVNFLPLRAQWRRETTFVDHLHAVRREVLEAFEHQEYTLGTIVRKLAQPRQPNRLPLTELQFNLERLANHIEAGGVAIEVEPNAKAHVNYDMFWNVTESSEGLRIDCDYNTDLFDRSTIERWMACYETLLQSMVADVAQPVTRIAYVPRAEMRLIEAANATQADYPRQSGVQHLFEQQARATPDAAAILFDGAKLSYGELDRRANQLAHHLRARFGADGGRIGVLVERSPEMVVALMAAWKAGFAYVPLDPAHPRARLRYALESAKVVGVVTGGLGAEAASADGLAIVDLRQERSAIDARPSSTPGAGATGEATAYVIYTSGSTGKPKGVEVGHGSLVNLLVSMANRPGLRAGDTLLALTTIAFDIAALELFGPLLVGGAVAIAKREDAADGARLCSAIDAYGATIIQATPSSWRMLLDAGFRGRPGLKMLCGGESLPRDLADRLLEGGGALWNMYGPTETTVWSSCGEVVAGSAPITIGQPLANTQLHVLDRYDQPTPIGLPGQLHIGGAGVAKGYFGQEALTAEKFTADPANPGSRLYRTGDVVRRLQNGEIQVLGRMDTQIKLRGFRIELEEIEAVLSRIAGSCAVALREDTPGEPRLVGYLAGPAASALADQALQAKLAEELPSYMIPAIWVRLDALPIGPSGKLDRAALPVPDFIASPALAFEEPKTPLEQSLALIFAEVLGLDRISRDADIFSFGADSIHLFRIAARANGQGIRLSARQLILSRTVTALASALEAERDAPTSEARATPRRLLFPLDATGRAAK